MNSELDLVARQQAWLKAVLAARREDPTTLARGASLSPTTLTRFLNDPEYPHALSARTIAAIEQFTGFVAYDPPAGTAEPDAVPFTANHAALGAAINALLSKGTSAWRLNRPTLTALGYMPGDVVIVDGNAKPAAGDAVAADVRGWPNNGDAVTVMRVYHPPILVAAGGDPTAFPPLMIDDRTIVVRGVIVAGIRRRAR